MAANRILGHARTWSAHNTLTSNRVNASRLAGGSRGSHLEITHRCSWYPAGRDVAVPPRRGCPAGTWLSRRDVAVPPGRGCPAATWLSRRDMAVPFARWEL